MTKGGVSERSVSKMDEFVDNTKVWGSWRMTTKRMLKATSKAGVPNCLTLHYDTVVYIRAVSLLDHTRVMGHRLGTPIQSKSDQNGEWELGCSVVTSRRASLLKVTVGGTSHPVSCDK